MAGLRRRRAGARRPRRLGDLRRRRHLLRRHGRPGARAAGARAGRRSSCSRSPPPAAPSAAPIRCTSSTRCRREERLEQLVALLDTRTAAGPAARGGVPRLPGSRPQPAPCRGPAGARRASSRRAAGMTPPRGSGELRMPCLVAAGRHDGIAPPERSVALAAAIPSARLAVFDGGHGVLLQDPGGLADDRCVPGELQRRQLAARCGEPGDPLDDLLDRQPGRVELDARRRPRAAGSPRGCGRARRAAPDLCEHGAGVAAALGGAPARALGGVGVEVDLQLASGRHDGADVAPLGDPVAVARAARRCFSTSAARTAGSAATRDARSETSGVADRLASRPRRRAARARPRARSRRRPRAPRGSRARSRSGSSADAAVHRAAVEVAEAEPLGERARHRRLAGPGGPVDRDDHARKLQRRRARARSATKPG